MQSLLVKDYLCAYPAKFTADMSIEEASEKLIESHHLGGPVLDSTGHVIGFLSESDILEKIINTGYFSQQCCTVEQLMRTDVLTVKPYDTILELAQQMLKQKPKVYPVVDDSGHWVGNISRTSVLAALDSHIKASYHLTRSTGNHRVLY
ncbi:CBS domain-containing protein [Thalassotalea maritima]|uniref:CBS domain-containing protein n=1 Tax=Thalassotalea maritima TaxID=3242416 RepID=UPI003526E601